MTMRKRLGMSPTGAPATGRASMPPPIHVPATSRAPVNVLGARPSHVESFEIIFRSYIEILRRCIVCEVSLF
jgi:hypothetical protein